ncbi:MAG: S8 family peptidase [Sedimentisphaerales bacterium]|nr:S8 family peptidase [Sedimentisphaerales bacterium]
MAISLPCRTGVYLEFKSQADFDLVTKSLENIRSGIRLLNVKEVRQGVSKEIVATVYVPASKEGYFLKKIQQYSEQETEEGNPKNQKLINSIEDIRLAVLESFWQDPLDLLPGAAKQWCEIWLRTGFDTIQAQEVVSGFKTLCGLLNLQYQDEFLVFPERAVVLAKANRDDLTNLIKSSDSIAEFRLAKETARFWLELTPKEQAQWVQNLRNRLHVNRDADVAITILDTGVNNGHELLSPILDDEDCHTYKEEWGREDHNGHGTNMAGLAVYGDLQKELEHGGPVQINHKLESVKILPPQGDNDPKEWGAITQQSISRVEIQAASRVHIGCMAITAPETLDEGKQGRPSSWSSAIDAMTAGYLDDTQRLFIVSAGNIRDERDYNAYPDSNQTKAVENPGQSWNALTIGAYTTKDRITDPACRDHQILAPPGGLSPYSTTSLIWDKNKWPYKPDIVFEGGNRGRPPGQPTSNYEDLSLLTTHYNPAQYQFEIIDGTSPATAQAALLAAQIQSAYHNAWPETIRGLMIHSSEWTDTMIQQFGNGMRNRNDVSNLLRICGYGVPDISRAMTCAGNSLTLIAQEYIQPFDKKESGGGYRTKDMHIHELPWPRQVLLDLGATPVELRVTLSYFIEPGPGEIGWKDRYRYASHALRFDVNSPNESRQDFLARLNNAARDEEYDRVTAPENRGDRWLIGKQNRKFGSVHSDTWKSGTAADVAACNLIGVYPVIGWWRERHHLKRWNRRSRYSLIVSLRTPAETVDLYTPVATLLRIPIEI